MRLLFIMVLNSLFINLSAQDARCKNEMNIKVTIKGMNVGDSIVTLTTLSNAEGLIAEDGREIVSFTATLYSGGEVSEFSSWGSKFSDSNRKWFSKLKASDAVYFSDIKARINGVGVCLKSFYCRISE